MLTVEADYVHRVEGTNRYVAEASDIGIRAGESWPDFIAVLVGDDGKGGRNGALFLKGRVERDRDLVFVEYATNDGVVLTVYND